MVAKKYHIKSGAPYLVRTHIPDRNKHQADRTLCGRLWTNIEYLMKTAAKAIRLLSETRPAIGNE